MNTYRSVCRFAVASALAAASALSYAGPSPRTQNLLIDATVVESCYLQTTPIHFGAYDPVDVNATTTRDASGTVLTTCTIGTPVPAISLDSGLNNANAGATETRAMHANISGLDYYMNYSLSASFHGPLWADTDTVVAPTPSGVSEITNVYGRISAGQNNLAVGAYQDTVLVTVAW
jgi:spore coat protein U-like protein